MGDAPTNRPCDKPQPPEGHEEPKPQQNYPKPDLPTPTPEQSPVPRDCGKPEMPADPCKDPNALNPPENCDAQPFGEHIKDLEKQSNQADQDSPKGELAAYKKLSDEVWKAEKEYAKEYETLLFQELASETFSEKLKADLENGKITLSERKRIAEIVYCAQNVDALRKEWIEARDALPDLQNAVAKAQNKFFDQDEKYKEALTKFQAAQKKLDALQAQATKELNARNYRGAWFLNEYEICPALETPPRPCGFNNWLEGVADEHAKLSEVLRKAKVALEQKTAEAQKKKKDFDDAKAKRLENILKVIASDPFPAELKPSTPASSTSSNYQSTGA